MYISQLDNDTIESYRIKPGQKVSNLGTQDSAIAKANNRSKKENKAALKTNAKKLAKLQEKMFANSSDENADSLLLVLQAMDTAGKGGIVKHVAGEVDSQGISLYAFKKPTEEDLSHDFLWRIKKRVPSAGKIGIFDRSHYEDVLIHRVRQLSSQEEIERRYGAISDFEKELENSRTHIVKIMLNISPDEQQSRLLARLENAKKNWKYSPGDVDERQLWPQYMDAYKIAIERSTTDSAPWYVVPANDKYYARVVVSQILVNTLENLGLQWPEPDFDVQEEIQRVKNSNPV